MPINCPLITVYLAARAVQFELSLGPQELFFIIQSTTRITEFLVVDKSSVILVKQPKFR